MHPLAAPEMFAIIKLSLKGGFAKRPIRGQIMEVYLFNGGYYEK